MKRRILVVGGMAKKNVPDWVLESFNIEHFESTSGKSWKPNSGRDPDAVVVLNAWVSHKHFFDAREIAEKLSVPFIVSPGGWSAAIQKASDQGIDWFADSIQETTSDESGESDVVNNAWQEAYSKEWEARKALERRYSRDKKLFDSAKKSLKQAEEKGAAADRVITEVREAAKEQRARLAAATEEFNRRSEEIRQRNNRLSECLSSHFDVMKRLLDRIAVGEEALSHAVTIMKETRGLLESNMAELSQKLESAITSLKSEKD